MFKFDVKLKILCTACLNLTLCKPFFCGVNRNKIQFSKNKFMGVYYRGISRRYTVLVSLCFSQIYE
jgi:hypothetical protein